MKPWSDSLPPTPASRIIAAESLRGVAKFALGELDAAAAGPRLSIRDLDNEVARAAYALGRRRGFEQGAQAGLQQGYSEGSQALDDFQSRKAADVGRQMQQLVDNFRAEMTALQSQVASDLVSLAIDIARQVLRREISGDPQALLPVASEALRVLGEGASEITLRVNPADAEVLRAHLEVVAQGRAWRIETDPAVMRSGCHVEADTGVADASFEARWQAVMASLGRDEEPMPEMDA